MQAHEVALSEVRAGASLRTKCSEGGRPLGAPGKRVPTQGQAGTAARLRSSISHQAKRGGHIARCR